MPPDAAQRRYHLPRHLRRRRPARGLRPDLRATEPVAWTEEADGGRGFWSLTKYDDVLYASRHTELFSSRLGIRMEDMDAEETEARRTMMEMDSPEHTRLRRIVARPFTPRAVADYEGAVRELARKCSRTSTGERSSTSSRTSRVNSR
jgi:cytochrome P450